MSSAVVIGSLHWDLIAKAAHLPAVGQSVSGGTFAMTPGGKAGNQAIALARNGIDTYLITRVGNDDFGRQLTVAMASADVRTDHIAIDSSNPTGVSTVLASDEGYSSIICPGAAGQLSIPDLDAARTVIESAGMVVCQRELDPDFVNEAIRWCATLGKPVMFNASPPMTNIAEIGATPWADIAWLIVNEIEADGLCDLVGLPASAPESRYRLLQNQLGVANMIVTLGGEGSLWFGSDGILSIPAFPADVIDTVGAGDAFLGTVAASLIEHDPVTVALRRASAAGSITVGQSGAYEAIPTRAAIDRFLTHQAQSS
jgi:ribokinase